METTGKKKKKRRRKKRAHEMPKRSLVRLRVTLSSCSDEEDERGIEWLESGIRRFEGLTISNRFLLYAASLPDGRWGEDEGPRLSERDCGGRHTALAASCG